jgi:hypothetical protein
MPEQHLYGAEIRALVQQVRCEAVAQGFLVLLMICIQRKSSIAITRIME